MNYVYSPSVENLGGIMEPMNFISPIIPSDLLTPTTDLDSGYGISKAYYGGKLGGAISDVAATLDIVNALFGR